MHEDKLTKLVGLKLKELLEAEGHRTQLIAPSSAKTDTESLRSRVSAANQSGADYFISIHFNAFNKKAHGTEVYVNALSNPFTATALSVVENIASLGFQNRGVKAYPYYVLKHTKMPAMLIECCFCDCDRDMKLFDADRMAIAILSGLLGKKIVPAPSTLSGFYPATLEILVDTLLKPLPEQSSEIQNLIDGGEIKRHMLPIKPGEYKVLFLGEEEGHFAIEYLGKEWFIFCGHVKISGE